MVVILDRGQCRRSGLTNPLVIKRRDRGIGSDSLVPTILRR